MEKRHRKSYEWNESIENVLEQESHASLTGSPSSPRIYAYPPPAPAPPLNYIGDSWSVVLKGRSAALPSNTKPHKKGARLQKIPNDLQHDGLKITRRTSVETMGLITCYKTSITPVAPWPSKTKATPAPVPSATFSPSLLPNHHGHNGTTTSHVHHHFQVNPHNKPKPSKNTTYPTLQRNPDLQICVFKSILVSNNGNGDILRYTRASRKLRYRYDAVNTNTQHVPWTANMSGFRLPINPLSLANVSVHTKERGAHSM